MVTVDPRIAMILFPPVAYLIGSVPFGVLISRRRGVDLRRVGSGNIGATNVARAIGRKWGYACFFLDTGKGLVPTALSVLLVPLPAEGAGVLAQSVWLGTGCGVILGHVFSLYLRFRGGKGVATALGVVIGIYPYFTWAGLAALGLWCAVTLISRYVSLGSVVAALGFVPLFAAFNWPVGRYWPLLVFAAAMVVLILFRHRSNIRRLLAGTESKLKCKQPAHGGPPDAT